MSTLKYGQTPRGDGPPPARLDVHQTMSPRKRAEAKREAREAADLQRQLRDAFYARQGRAA